MSLDPTKQYFTKYVNEKLGEAFTGENSGMTVTEFLSITSGETEEKIEEATSGKVDTTDYSAYTASTNTALDNKQDISGMTGYTTTEVTSSLSGKTITVLESSNSSISAKTSTASDGTVKYDVTTDAEKISGLTAVNNSDEGAAKISGVSATDSVKTGIKRLYDSLASEIAARKAAMLARTITSANKAINVSETPNADGFGTTIALKLDEATNGTGNEKTGNDNSLTITDNGLFLSSSWDCGNF